MTKYTLHREESLLLVIDIQERLVPVIRCKDEVIKNAGILISIAKEMNIPILITEQYPRGLGPTVAEINQGFEDKQRFEKTLFSACTDELIEALKGKKRKKVIITGMETHVCVFQTVRDLLRLNYEVFVAADGVSSRFKENHINGLNLIRDMGATITNTETVLFDLLKEAGTSEFGTLSKLIK